MISPSTNTGPKRPKGRVLIIDDEQAMGYILMKSLKADGYETVAYTKPLEALAAIAQEQPDVILTDLRMPMMTGQELLERVKAEHPHIPVLIMTAYGTIEDAVSMLKAGAFNYITKPFQHANLLHQIELAIGHRRLEQEVTRLSEGFESENRARLIIGNSPELEQVREVIRRAAQNESVALITGESGVGKELVAREIHRLSPRAGKRFVAVNCPAIPPTLIESELFGYERGAFTGADKPKMGLIELSAGGTLFLDEIAELPVELQAKLLRVVQEHEIQRIGGLKQIPVDLRIIAATNRNLQSEIKAGRFRMDLFYRLNVISIHVPPLRERTADIAPLMEHFLQRIARRNGRAVLRVDDRVMSKLKGYLWPGNIRELENALERMATVSVTGIIEEKDLPVDLLRDETLPEEARAAGHPFRWAESYKDARDDFERSYLRQLLLSAQGNMALAARISGISRRHLYEKLKGLGLDKDAALKEIAEESAPAE